MVQAIRKLVRVEEGGVVTLRCDGLSPGSQVEVIVLTPASNPPRPPLASFRGTAKGVYPSVEHADAFIRAERDQWDR